jgi:hypothetical protein
LIPWFSAFSVVEEFVLLGHLDPLRREGMLAVFHEISMSALLEQAGFRALLRE